MFSYLHRSRFPLILVVSTLVFLTAIILNITTFSFSQRSLKYLKSSSAYVKNLRTGVSYYGRSINGVEHYQNVFYAEDTAGSNRFASPVPYMPSPGTTVDATAAGALCPQGVGDAALPWISPTTNISENCLSLRIARPAGIDATSKLPVLVYIHGGGFMIGSASDQLYRPDGLVRQAKSNGQPVIYVGINYRLGIFGFAMSKALKASRQANIGLRDQRAAFNWIHNNIEAFGGNPDDVIAIGQSAGAISVGLHMTSYLGKQGVPFQKAVMISGATGTNFNMMSDLVMNNTASVAQSVGCDPNSMDCLRETPLEILMNASVTLARKLRPPLGELVFIPSYDGDYIPGRPSELLRIGHFVKGIPLMSSWTINDGAWYAHPSVNDDASLLANIQKFVTGLSQSSLQRLLSLFPLSDFNHLVRPNEQVTAQYYRAAQLSRDFTFTCPVIDFTWKYTKFGAPSIWLYAMNQTKFAPILDRMGVPQWRICHTADIPYLMNEDTEGADNSDSQQSLSASLSGSIAAFAYSGDPNVRSGKGFQTWPSAYPKQDGQTLAREFPDSLDVFIIGGPEGNNPASTTLENITDVPQGSTKALAWEKITERCRFINSISEEIGV